MSVTQTRTSNNLIIHSATRLPDGKVLIRFSIMKAGMYYNVRAYTKAFSKKFPAGFIMTPAIGHPMHAPDPLFVPFAGAVFNYVWDAPADGFGTGSLYGWTFQLAYVDFLCCDEIDEGFNLTPGGSVPPGLRPPGEPGSGEPDPVPVPLPGIAPGDGVNPGEPNGNGTAGETDPNAGLTEPSVPTVLPRQRTGDGGLLVDPTIGPILPPWHYDPRTMDSQTAGGVPIVPAPDLVPSTFDYTDQTDVSTPPRPVSVGTPPPVRVQTVLPVTGTQQTQQGYQLDEYRPLPPYRIAPEFAGLFSLPSSSGGLSVRAAVPVPGIPTPRSNLYYVVENSNPSTMSGIHSMALAMDGNGTIYVLREAAAIQATGRHHSTNPPGVIPPGTNAGDAICIDWPQFGTSQMRFLVVLMNQVQQVLAAAVIPGFFNQPGTLPPPNSQNQDLLGPGVRAIAGFYAGILPKYEGSVNGVGFEDTYVFTVVNTTPAIVVKISADAQQAGFLPVMKIYDVDDMTTPLVTHSARFQAGGTDVDPTSHSIGWRDDSHVLTVGNKYAIVIEHSAMFYSRRWDFQIFHDESIVQTGGTLTIESGLLAGEISCSYGRQSIQILNTKTDQSIFVKTNERGVTYDIQKDTTAGSNGRTLAVSYGDVLEIIRPGPGVLYRRHGDLIGKVQL